MRIQYKIGLSIGVVLALYETWAFTSLKEWELLVPGAVLVIGVSFLTGYFILTFTIHRTRKPLVISLATVGAIVFGFITASLLLELIL